MVFSVVCMCFGHCVYGFVGVCKVSVIVYMFSVIMYTVVVVVCIVVLRCVYGVSPLFVCVFGICCHVFVLFVRF